MLVIQLGILLLSFTVPPAVSAKSHANPSCPNRATSANDVQKCVAIDLLWGWLHVVNKTSERLLEVRQNATKIEKGAEELRKEANGALRNATEILAELNKESNDARTVSEVMKNIRDAIVWANESERNASLAVDATRVAETLARDGYGAVSLGARYFKGWNSVQELKYDALKTKIGEITISKANGCAEVHNVSGVLTDYAEKLNGIATNLTEWKVKMTEIIKTTYNSTQSNKSTCLSLFNHEKVEQVTAAVANLSERLIVAVKQVNTSLLAREKAAANIAAANKNMETMTASMMNFLERNGAELCDMLRQREALWTKLNETKQRLKGVSQGASTTLVSTAKIKGATADTDELVRDALKEVEGLSKFSVFSASTESLSSRSVTLAREAMENAMKASEQAAKLSDRTKSRFAFVDEEVESEYEKLKGLENNLRKLSKEAHIDISGGNTNECNGKLVNKLETSTKDLLRSAAKLNTSKLLEANRTLGRLAELVVQINTNVDSISTDVELASRKLKSAREFGHSATMAAESAVTEALEQLMNKLCATAAELRVLRSNWALLSATATNIKKRVSEEEAHAIAVLKTVRGSSDMSPYVEEGFTVAVRMATLLDRELQRSNAQFGKVTADYTAGKLVGVRADNTVCFDAVRNAVAKVFAGIYERLHKDACGKNATIELVQKLKAESGGLSLLRNATAITKLSHFAMKMSDELAGAVKRMSTAAVRAAEANEALAEAVRRAREESAGLRCSPLYRQLLNALGGMW